MCRNQPRSAWKGCRSSGHPITVAGFAPPPPPLPPNNGLQLELQPLGSVLECGQGQAHGRASLSPRVVSLLVHSYTRRGSRHGGSGLVCRELAPAHAPVQSPAVAALTGGHCWGAGGGGLSQQNKSPPPPPPCALPLGPLAKGHSGVSQPAAFGMEGVPQQWSPDYRSRFCSPPPPAPQQWPPVRAATAGLCTGVWAGASSRQSKPEPPCREPLRVYEWTKRLTTRGLRLGLP